MPVAFEGFQAVGRGIFRSSKKASSAAHMAFGTIHIASSVVHTVSDPVNVGSAVGKDYAVYQALEGVSTFAITYAASFSTGSERAKDCARVDPLLVKIGKPNLSPGVPASPATGGKAALVAEVREDLVVIAGTADTIALKEPGFAASFRLGANTQRDTLADAATFLGNLKDPAVVAKFVAYVLDPGFVQDLMDDLAAIGGKGEEQDEHQQDATGDTARIRALIKEGRELLKALGTSVTNRFRRDPEDLAKWHTASHIQRAPRRAATPLAPVPDPV